MIAVKASSSAFLLSALICMASCNDQYKAPGGARSDPLSSNSYPQIASMEGLEEFLGWDAPIVSHDGVLVITTPVRALTDGKELNVQYRFFFFTQDGRPLDSNPNWRFKRLPSRTQVFLEGNALDSNAEDWRLEIRPAR